MWRRPDQPGVRPARPQPEPEHAALSPPADSGLARRALVVRQVRVPSEPLLVAHAQPLRLLLPAERGEQGRVPGARERIDRARPAVVAQAVGPAHGDIHR